MNLNLLDLNSSGQSQWLTLQRVSFDSTTCMDFEVQPSMKRKWKPLWYILPSSIRLYLVISEQVRGRVRRTNHGRCAEPIMAWLCAGHSTTLTHLHSSSKYSSMALERVGSIGLGPSETIFTELAWEGEAGGAG